MDIRDYLDSARGIVTLPPGNYQFNDPIPKNWEGLQIVSQDVSLPATVEKLIVYAAGVNIDNLSFADSKLAYDKSAVVLRGTDCTVTRCQILSGYQYGIEAEKKAYIEANSIFGFSDDGIRFCGNGTIISRNTIGLMATEVREDKAHRDCMQGWAGDVNSPFRSAERFDAKHALIDIQIIGNNLIDRPGSQLQGITFFDGLADNWIVEGNNIQLFGPHPLTIMGLRSGSVENNLLQPGQKQYLPPARQWVASTNQWRSVTEQVYLEGTMLC